MPVVLAWSYTTADAVTLTLTGVLVIIVALIGYRAWLQSRVTPEERERQRRAHLVARGKISDAVLVEIRDEHLFYSYGVRGVEYTASQDISRLRQFVPADLSTVGPVSVKYDARNPANSIVVAEKWTGLHAGKKTE